MKPRDAKTDHLSIASVLEEKHDFSSPMPDHLLYSKILLKIGSHDVLGTLDEISLTQAGTVLATFTLETEIEPQIANLPSRFS